MGSSAFHAPFMPAADVHRSGAPPIRWRVYAALFCSLTLWASAFPAAKVSLQAYSPLDLAALRFLVASFVLAGAAMCCKIRWPRKGDLPLIFTLALIGFPFYHAIFNYGQRGTSAGAAAFIVNCSPVFTALLAWRFLGEKVTARGWIGVLICVFGVFLIAYAQGATFTIGINTLALLVAAVCWSIFCVLQKPLLNFYTPLELICYTVWIGTLFLTLVLPHAVVAFVQAPWSPTFSTAYLGLCSAVAHVSWAYVLARMPASRASVFGFLVPLLAVGIAFFWIHEVPTLLLLTGGAAVLCGVRVATRQEETKSFT